MAACPSDEFLYELAAGALDSAGLETADHHLDQCESCRALIAELALAAGGDGALPRGAQIDRYIILDVVGRGAMGTVYTAFDPELDRRIALKLLRADIDTELLLAEAVTMAKVSQPNVVAVFDAGRSGGATFLAMELVEGKTLREWLGERKRSWRETRDVFVAAARGVAAAHAAGVIHRDIKPDNILVANDGTVKVSDFGVASGSDGAILETGLFAGTPVYMAPEVLAGEKATLRSDQFSLCASLFEALSGGRPFDAESGDIASLSEAMQLGPTTTAPGPGWLARAVARGLSPKSGDRYASINDVIDALETDRRRAPLRRGVLAGAAVAAAAALTFAVSGGSEVALLDPCEGGEAQIGSIFTSAKMSELTGSLKAHELARVREDADKNVAALQSWADDWAADHRRVCRASRVDGLQSSALLDARVACLERRQREGDALLTALVGDGAELAAVGNAIAELRPSKDCVAMQIASLTDPATASQKEELPAIEQALAEARAKAALGRFAEAATDARRAADDASAISYKPATAAATLLLAQVSASSDKLADARAAGKTALSTAMAARADNLVAEALITLAAIEGEAGELDAAADYVRLANAASERLLRPAALEGELGIVTGMILMARGDLAAAKEVLEQTLALGRQGGQPRLLTALGDVSKRLGDLETALTHHRAALAVNRERLGEAHPAVATNLHNVAGVLREKGELSAALELYEQALATKRAALGDAHSEVALTRNSMALVFIEQGDLAGARRELQTAEAILLATGHPELASVKKNLAIASPERKSGPNVPPKPQEPKTKEPKTEKPTTKKPPPDLSYESGKPWQKGR